MSRQIITTTRPDGTRSTYTLQPGSAVPMQLEALKPLKPSRIKADRRTYPKYKPGMSTAQYVAEFEARNGCAGAAGFWQPLNTAPAAGYAGIDTVEHGDFELMAEDAPAAAAQAPVPPAAPVAAPAAAPEPVAPELVADPAPSVIPWQILAARPTATYCTQVRRIGVHEWACVVYLHDTYGACTDYVWRRVSDARAGGQYEGGRFFPGREWPTYDSNHASHGQPATLAKLYAAHEAEIRAALAAGRPSPLEAWQAAAARAGVDPVATDAESDSMADACADRFGMSDPAACVHLAAFPDWHRAALAEIRGWGAPAAAPTPDPAAVEFGREIAESVLRRDPVAAVRLRRAEQLEARAAQLRTEWGASAGANALSTVAGLEHAAQLLRAAVCGAAAPATDPPQAALACTADGLATAWDGMAQASRIGALQAAEIDMNTPTGRASVQAKRAAALGWAMLPASLRQSLAPVVALRLPRDVGPGAPRRMSEALAILAAAVQPAAVPPQEAPAPAGAAAAPPDDGGRAARLAALVVGMVGTDPAQLAPALRRESARVAAAAAGMPAGIGDSYRRTADSLAELATAADARGAPVVLDQAPPHPAGIRWRPILARPARAGAFPGLPPGSWCTPYGDIGTAADGRGGRPAGRQPARVAPTWGGWAAPGAFPATVLADGRAPCSDIGAAIDRASAGPGPGGQLRSPDMPPRWQAVRAPDLLRRTTRARQAPAAARIRQPRAPAWGPAVATSAHRFGAWLAPPARIRGWTAHTFPPPVATSARRAAAA